MAGVPTVVGQRTLSGRQRKRNPSMSTSPHAGGREKKRAEIRIEGGAQALIPAGRVAIQKGGVIEVGVGVQIGPIGTKSTGTLGSGSPSMPVTVDITEPASAAQFFENECHCIMSVSLCCFLYIKIWGLNSFNPLPDRVVEKAIVSKA